MNNKNILFDIDGIILDFTKAFAKASKDVRAGPGCPKIVANPEQYDFNFRNKTIIKELIADFIRHKPTLDLIDDGLPEMLKKLENNYYNVAFVTMYPDQQTRKMNLERYDLWDYPLYFPPSKLELVKNLRPDIVVEDMPTILQEIHDYDPSITLFTPSHLKYTREIRKAIPSIIAYDGASDLLNKILEL